MSFDEQPRRKKYTTSIHLSPKKLSLLYERYKAREISLSQLSQMTGWCARQASRNYKKYITTGESIVVRGYGSHLPFTTEQCFTVLKLSWEGNDHKQIAAALDVPLKKIKRPLTILSHPTMKYSIIQYEDKNLYSFLVGIKMNAVKDEEIYLHFLYNKEINCIISKNIHHGNEKIELKSDGKNKEEYEILINKILKNMSEDYYQSFKMRRMLDRENNDERLVEYIVYFQKHINKLENNEISIIIKQLIETASESDILHYPLYSCSDSKCIYYYYLFIYYSLTKYIEFCSVFVFRDVEEWI